MTAIDELTDDELDDAVARALGGEIDGDGWRFDPPLEMEGVAVYFFKKKRSFCRDWSYGGPIIESAYIGLARWPDGRWSADIPGPAGNPATNPNPKLGELGHVLSYAYGPTPLVAAMRAFVASFQPTGDTPE